MTGQLESAPDTTYTIELFTTGGVSAPGTSARQFVGSTTVTTNGLGVGTFGLSIPGLASPDFLAATATTETAGLTSELSDALAIAPVPLHTITGTVLENGAPLANVTIALTGTISATTTTDATGHYVFANLPEGGAFTITPSLLNYAFVPEQVDVTNFVADRIVDFTATLLIRSRFITEGVTGPFWHTTLSLLNASNIADNVELRYVQTNGTVQTQTIALGAHSHVTIDPSTVAGLEQAAFSTEVRSTQPIVAMRDTRWGTNGELGAHAEQAVDSPRESWYFAEGATSCFSLFYLLQNPGAQPAEGDVQFLRRAPQAPVLRHYTLAPHSRFTVNVNDEPGLAQSEVAARIQVANGVPILAERSMYSSCGGVTWRGGHSAAASPASAMSWFLAEGATGTFFDLYVLVANFLTMDATVDVTYWLADGTTITRPHTIPALSRITIDVAGEDPRLASAEVSTRVTATNGVPVVVERAQWWPHGAWYEGHASAGVTEPGVEWQLAGVTLGDPLAAAYVLIANTGDSDGQAQVRVVYADGAVQDLAQPLTIRAHSRTTMSMVEGFPDTRGKRFGVIITSVGETPAPIVVELSSYQDAERDGGRQFWATGTNVVATRVR